MDALKKPVQRHLSSAVAQALADTPVVCLLGPRQCGKSTLAGMLAPERAYYSLDDHNYLKAAQADPVGFLAQLPDYVTLDEVQRAPELFLAIKRSVDTDRRPGRFFLTGSANLLQLPRLEHFRFILSHSSGNAVMHAVHEDMQHGSARTHRRRA